jgi:hypothetical protein
LEKVNKSVKDLEELVKAGDEKRSLEKRVSLVSESFAVSFTESRDCK